jgi:hypothetical protein
MERFQDETERGKKRGLLPQAWWLIYVRKATLKSYATLQPAHKHYNTDIDSGDRTLMYNIFASNISPAKNLKSLVHKKKKKKAHRIQTSALLRWSVCKQSFKGRKTKKRKEMARTPPAKRVPFTPKDYKPSLPLVSIRISFHQWRKMRHTMQPIPRWIQP